ncbi:ABC transporter permease [Nocardiopsis dassonvillei]|uniref:Transport permease protein n=1 Tax=Nocardiopsis dassonvillei (strain ATCC 23218 / DSM 43111 / CIP 107115 / JCM 7437 / KCTC 9190 / NBRC 14626 / NCTC 10488 / NRRL B-5397 / IMRU 509) TaxID=446468 RepID=D7AV42_NOCDD|nr:ABC transporter permease [Nocardiopsis dassonvillei]ADH69592.1 ABC-2 type transporter [Nocardiopsis dassonvillei subsp. dassonvillei DSM 43111]APC37592.1 multidrug ABC transporter permease [Nocardiopsis dassonvillei]NKY81679.1 ABC transporter permease [Nocardiopsis dassonvillei]VEI90104.1 Daunorubicin/doxorubicin resistance ABC transporter permease protein drrB [Nocardiopsis dassonvillei]
MSFHEVTGTPAGAAGAETAGAPAARGPGLVRDTVTVFARQMRPFLHRPPMLFFGMLQPVLYLVLFAPLLTGLAGAEGQDPWQWFVPGLLVMLGLFTAGFAGFGLLPEMSSGAHERLLATPVSRVSLLLGRVLRDVVMMLAQMVLILVLVVPLGFEASLAGAVVGLLLLAVLGAGLATLSYLAALAVKQTYVFAPIVQTLIMPLMLLSGVLLPMELAPPWLYALSRANPVAYVVDAERALFAGQWDASVALGWAVAVVLAVAALAGGSRAMRRLSS